MRFQSLSLALLASFLLPMSACGEKDATSDTGESDADTDTDSDADVDLVDAGDDRDSAMATTFDSDSGTFEVDGLINPAGDRDFYAFDGVAGEAYGFWAQSYYFYEEVLADTVMRIWDETGSEPVATNDDMPFRMWETDSAIFFAPETDGTYYVEILEWSDWLDDEHAADGSSDMEYTLVGFQVATTEYEPNDSSDDVDEWPEETGVFRGSFTDGYADFAGIVDYADDVDLYPMTFDDDGTASWCQFGLWPDAYTISPEMTLYNELMEPVAQSTDVDVKPQWFAFYDAGITFRVPEEGGVYYLGVTDIDGNEGAGTYYPGLNVCWTYNEDLENPGGTQEAFEEETNDSAAEPNTLEFSESDNTAGYYYSWLYGNLEEQDPGDWMWLKASDVGGSLDGMYLNVELATESLGSFLDAEVTLYSYDASNGSIAELATAEAAEDGAEHDLQIRDLQLGADENLVIEISGTSASVDAANNWISLVTVYSDATYADAE